MRYLGIDYGARVLGLAVSDPGGQFAFPLEILPHDSHALENIAHVVSEKGIGGIVMGNTRAENGSENRVTEACEKFAAQLGLRTNIPVELVREAWSSFEAARYAPDQKKRDDAAAAIILQRYLETKRGQ